MSNNDNENNAIQVFGYMDNNINVNYMYPVVIHVQKRKFTVLRIQMKYLKCIALAKQTYPIGDKCYNYTFNTFGENN